MVISVLHLTSAIAWVIRLQICFRSFILGSHSCLVAFRRILCVTDESVAGCPWRYWRHSCRYCLRVTHPQDSKGYSVSMLVSFIRSGWDNVRPFAFSVSPVLKLLNTIFLVGVPIVKQWRGICRAVDINFFDYPFDISELRILGPLHLPWTRPLWPLWLCLEPSGCLLASGCARKKSVRKQTLHLAPRRTLPLHSGYLSKVWTSRKLWIPLQGLGMEVMASIIASNVNPEMWRTDSYE